MTEQETLVETFVPIIDKIAEMSEVEEVFLGIDGEKERTQTSEGLRNSQRGYEGV